MTVCQMARFRSMSPINSIKHIIDAEGTLLSAGTKASVTIVNVVPNVDPTTFVPGDVRVGSKVNGLFLTVFVIGSTGSAIGAFINWYICKLHEGQTNSLAVVGSTGVSKIRNQIFHEEKGLAGSADGTAMAFKGVIAIPRSFRRMREGDKIQLVLALNANATTDAIFCVKSIYKSFY